MILCLLKQSANFSSSLDDVRMIRFKEYQAASGSSVQQRLLGPPISSPSEDDSDLVVRHLEITVG